MHWSEIWNGQNTGPRAIRLVLTPASWVYAFGWNAYQSLYRVGIKRATAPHCPVICVGNLTVGGSGKTPLTVYLAKQLGEIGYEVVLSCSGYGSPASEEATLAPEGSLSSLRWGDEPALLRDELPDTPLIVGRNRVRAAELCHKHFPKAILLMDDGFQHLPLKKHLTIILDSPTENHHCLPAGPYREPASHKRNADLVIPGRFQVEESPLEFVSPVGGVRARPMKVHVLCALGSPQRFIGSLKDSGLQIAGTTLKPDHDTLHAGNLLDGLPSDLLIAVTTKDWVKLSERTDIAIREWVIVKREIRVVPEEPFLSWLKQKLHEACAKRD